LRAILQPDLLIARVDDQHLLTAETASISLIAVRSGEGYIQRRKEGPAMTTQILRFVELSDEDRKETGRLGKLGKGDRVEVRVKRRTGPDQTLSLPPDAAALIEALLGHLLEGERVAVLTEDQELSPNDAASILGVSRPLVVHRMEAGELPFRYVGKHRRTKLKDVLGLKSKIDAQRAAMEALADDAEDLKQRYGA
jgi:excisionase family DNA binding protein